jgi:predicted esterase
LQYDKRSIGANFTILESNVWGNATFDDLRRDAERALDVLIQQPEVDSNNVALIGQSEGTTIVPRVAINNPGIVDNIVLMGALAQNLREIGDISTRSVGESCFQLFGRKFHSSSCSKHYYCQWNR